MPHSGTHFLSFWCDLGPKRSILGAPWRPAGTHMAPEIGQMAPKIAQMAPKLSKNLVGGAPLFAIIFLIEILVRLGAQKLDFGSPLAPSWSQNGAQNHPSGAKKGPESIIPRTILRHWKRALKKHNMLAFFTALFPSSLSERSFIQKYYANAFGKPLNPNKKKQIQIYKDSMRQ